MASMSDLVFLLLIFFLITSTLVSTSALNLTLPNSKSRVKQDQPKYTVSIDENYLYYVQGELIAEDMLESRLGELLAPHESANVRLETDKNVAVQHIVSVIDAVNTINKVKEAQHKVILATSPKRDR